MTYPSRLVAVGIGKETTYGVGVAPVLLLPVTQPAPVDRVGLLPDAGWRGSAVATYNHTPSTLASAVQLTGPVLADGIGFPLAGALGDVTLTTGSPNTWTMSVLNTGTQQPPSYSLVVSDPTGPLRFAGCKVSQLGLTLDPNGLFTWQASFAGLAGVATSALTLAPSAELVFPGWIGAIQLGGLVESRVLTGTLTIDRSVQAKRNVTGQQTPWLQRSDVAAVTGSFTLVAKDDTYRGQMIAGTQTTVDVTFTQGSGAGLRQVGLHCSKAFLTTVNRTYGSRWVELTVNFTTDGNTTDVGASGGYSPIKATIKNTVGAGVYA